MEELVRRLLDLLPPSTRLIVEDMLRRGDIDALASYIASTAGMSKEEVLRIAKEMANDKKRLEKLVEGLEHGAAVAPDSYRH